MYKNQIYCINQLVIELLKAKQLKILEKLKSSEFTFPDE